MMQSEILKSLTVPARFCGPPNSGNGGYTCGLVAKELGGVVECTLRSPVPMEVPLDLERSTSGGVLLHGKKVIVETSFTTIDVAPPAPIDLEKATAAMKSSFALDARHPFPTCFVCGPKRKAHDGLEIFPAAIHESLYAATWLPAAEFGNSRQLLRPEFLWAAMDCPTGFASGFPVAGKLVTGRLAVKQLNPIVVGELCLLLSWPLGVEGRKHFSAACLYQNQKPCAVARATWIRLET
ncbi:MAG TPA: hypothetical protein VLA83_14255 [Candidatus Binatia bacterium]|nr:hypothetical protein [Candidatus Binatia bacterium]